LEFNSIPTVYKGIKLKSRFEGNIAYLIDNLGYRWKYEPQSYKLPNGYDYLPDFYIPKLKLFIECRGHEYEKGNSQIEGFGGMIARGEIGSDLIKRPSIPEGCEFAYSDIYNEYLDYLVIGPVGIVLYECPARFGVSMSDEVSLCQCSKCGQWYFAGMSGSYQCRICGRWDGNKHIIDMRWLKYHEGSLLIGYRETTVKVFIEEIKETLLEVK